jgi:3-mercaptopropionate dioxygenase
MTLLSPPPRTKPGLEDLVAAIRAVVSSREDWQQTARRAAEALRGQLPSSEVLTGAQRGDPEDPRSRLLHVEPDGTFSILAIVWRPGQVTRIHDHVTWCVFGVIEGAQLEEIFTPGGNGEFLIPAGRRMNVTGQVSGFAPPGDIHRVGNPGGRTAISIHVYGTDLSRIGSSARRYYELPVQSGLTDAMASR